MSFLAYFAGWYLIGLLSTTILTFLDWYKLGMDVDGGDIIRNISFAFFGPVLTFIMILIVWSDHAQPILSDLFRDFSRKTLIKGRKVRR